MQDSKENIIKELSAIALAVREANPPTHHKHSLYNFTITSGESYGKLRIDVKVGDKFLNWELWSAFVQLGFS